MNKKEIKTIVETYKRIYNVQEVVGIDKSDTIYELKFLLDSLGLKKERYIAENEVITERDELKSEKAEYKMIFDDFIKYGVYVNYDLEEIEMYYDDLQFRMNDEEIGCNTARIDYIKERKQIKVA